MAFPHPSDPAFYLDDGATTYAPTGGGAQTAYGHVGGAARTFDFGPTQWLGFGAFEVSLLDMTTGDEAYHLVMEGNTASNFTGAFHDIASWNLKAPEPQIPVIVDTVYNDIHYRYGRLRLDISGTTPQIKLIAFLRSLAAAPEYTLEEKITADVTILNNLSSAGQKLRDWSAGPAWGGINSDGKYPLTDGSGNTLFVRSPSQIIAEASPNSPEYYGAIGDGNSHKAGEFYSTLAALQAKYPFAISLDQEMDYLGWQLAINHGGLVQATKHSIYIMMNNSGDPQVPLKLISDGFAWIEGNGCVFSYGQMVPVTTDIWYNSNYAFAPYTGWVNASIYSPDQYSDAVFSTGHGLHTDPATFGGARGNFCQFGTLYNLGAGTYEVILEATASLGASKDAGNFNYPYCSVQFYSESPGDGGNLSGASAFTNVNVLDGPATIRLSYVFSLSAPASGYLTFSGGGYANFDVTKLGVRKHILNCAIWSTRDGAADHYPLQMPFKGVRLEGPGRATVGSRGIYVHSYTDADGNLINYEDVRIAGFEAGVKFGNGAYLAEFTRVNIISCKYGYHFPPGLVNAGENLRLHGGGVSSCDILLWNEGGSEFSLFSSLLDYADTQTANNGQVIVGGGRIELHSCHCETRPNTVTGKPLFDIGYGTVTWFGGMILVAPGTCAEPPIKIENALSYMKFNDTDLYNVNSESGLMSTGAGQIFGRFRNNGNPNLAGMISDNIAMDVLAGAGKFPVPGLIDIDGGTFPYNDATQIDQWNSDEQAIAWSGAYTINGSNVVKVTKTYGTGSGSSIVILIPVPEMCNVFGSMSFLFPENNGTGTVQLYYRTFWVRSKGLDAFGRNILAEHRQFKGEVDISVPLEGSTEVFVRGFGSTYQGGSVNPDDGITSGRPPWATHLAAVIDTQSLYAGSFYFGDIKANVC